MCVIVTFTAKGIDDSNFLCLSCDVIQSIILDKKVSKDFIEAYFFYKGSISNRIESSPVLFQIPSNDAPSDDNDVIVIEPNIATNGTGISLPFFSYWFLSEMFF